MRLFLSALALLLVIEGSLFAAFPELMRKSLQEAGRTPAQSLRRMGILCLILALILGLALKHAGSGDLN